MPYVKVFRLSSQACHNLAVERRPYFILFSKSLSRLPVGTRIVLPEIAEQSAIVVTA